MASLVLPLRKMLRVMGDQMQDMRTHLEKLRVQVAECELISRLATDKKKKELFARLAEHHKTLAAAIERAMNEGGGK
jgi:hypothetical protein